MTEIGVSWGDSLRFRAVTVTSGRLTGSRFPQRSRVPRRPIALKREGRVCQPRRRSRGADHEQGASTSRNRRIGGARACYAVSAGKGAGSCASSLDSGFGNAAPYRLSHVTSSTGRRLTSLNRPYG